MASFKAAIEYQNSVLRAAYDAAIQRYTEALLAGVDDKKAQHELDATCERADNHYTQALEEIGEGDHRTPHAEVVVEARLADEHEQNTCDFVVVAQEV